MVFIYKIHCGTHVTDDVTDNIVVVGCPGSIPGGVLKKRKKAHILFSANHHKVPKYFDKNTHAMFR